MLVSSIIPSCPNGGLSLNVTTVYNYHLSREAQFDSNLDLG